MIIMKTYNTIYHLNSTHSYKWYKEFRFLCKYKDVTCILLFFLFLHPLTNKCAAQKSSITIKTEVFYKKIYKMSPSKVTSLIYYSKVFIILNVFGLLLGVISLFQIENVYGKDFLLVYLWVFTSACYLITAYKFQTKHIFNELLLYALIFSQIYLVV